jgi:hypothetical protein
MLVSGTRSGKRQGGRSKSYKSNCPKYNKSGASCDEICGIKPKPMIQQCRYSQLYHEAGSRRCMKIVSGLGFALGQMGMRNRWPDLSFLRVAWDGATSWVGGMGVALRAISCSIQYILLEYPTLIDTFFEIDLNMYPRRTKNKKGAAFS